MFQLTEASFSNAKGLKSQLGYVLVLVDSRSRGNIVHYGSNQCKRIARSVMASEIHALVLGFYMAYAVRGLAAEILGKIIYTEAMVDSKTVLDVIARDKNTGESV